MGRTAIEPAQPREHGALDAQACDLFRQAVYWALLARRGLAALPEVEGKPENAAKAPEFEALWATAEPDALARAAGDAVVAEGLRRSLANQSFVDFAALPSDEQARLARSLQIFAEALTRNIDGAELALEKLWIRRMFRLGLAVCVLALIGAGVAFGARRAEEARDLARGKPWVASSRFPEGGCNSPEQSCEASPFFFFCTSDDNPPWLEIDLGSVQTISGLKIDNRNDCCTERAVPLVAEVSVDRVNWREVARNTKEFRTWKADFKPAQARWFKLHIPKQAYLHLARVRVFR